MRNVKTQCNFSNLLGVGGGKEGELQINTRSKGVLRIRKQNVGVKDGFKLNRIMELHRVKYYFLGEK